MSKYYLGLDIGTDSVGFCVTDENYNIIKKHKTVIDGDKTKYYGNHLWGARLFDKASDASGRRLAREARRRYQRRKARIVLLQDLFKDERNKVDSCFFDRLNNSAIHLEDRDELLRQKHLLFNEKGYTDKEFYEKYPTIYHLRLARIEHPEQKFDIREIYLALAHRIKYRGNFLTEGERKSIGSDPDIIINTFNEIDNILISMNENDENVTPSIFHCTIEMAEALIGIFKTISKKGDLYDARITALKLPNSKSDPRCKMIALIAGSNKKLSEVFSDFNWEDLEETAAIKADFSDEDFTEKTLPGLASAIGDERTQILVKLKDLYSLRILANLLKGESSVSKAMVGIYERHQKQLEILKDRIRRYNPDKYSEFFRKSMDLSNPKKPKSLINYVNYIGFTDVKGKKIRSAHSVSEDDLYAAIKGILPLDAATSEGFIEKQPGDKDKLIQIKKEIEDKTYLPRQNSKENGVLPYQLNLNERRIILKNQSAYYPFLGELDTDFNNPDKKCYKIESILKYKIPYFVGPLSENATNHWIVKKSDERITPWNFHNVIDEEETANKFIENLKNYCTYLINEPTLPKESLIYQRYVLLNERNKWKINGAPIQVEDKAYLIKEVYFKKKKVSKKDVEEALSRHYKTDISISSSGTLASGEKGVTSDDFHASLSSWIAFLDDRAFGIALLHDKKKQELAEKIIYDITIFEDKELRKKRLTKYSLSPNQIKYISSLRFSDWAKFSNKLLTGLTTERVNTDTGEVVNYSIRDLRWETDRNFRQILTTKEGKNYKFDFRNQIEKDNNLENETLDEIIGSLYASPRRKRALHQTIKVVLELKKKLKIDYFDAYFVESTRSEQEKKRTKSRKEKILEYYKDAAKKVQDEHELASWKKELDKKDENELKGKKLFLYFRQGCKSVYTGEPIDINSLNTDYDIDHIIPQAKVKDDSFLNTVLVEKKVNNMKQDQYPIPKSILTDKGIAWIKYLSAISPDRMPKEKKNRILRSVNKPLTDQEISGFVQRQLVSTNQSVKAVCEVLKKIDKRAKIVYSRANYVSDFRKVFDLTKSREANDFHHAHDAYLNIVVGNTYDKLFSTGDPEVIKHKREYREALNRKPEYVFKHDARRLQTDTLIWKAKRYDEDGNEMADSIGTIDKVRKFLSYQDPLVTQRIFENVGEHGFFNHIHLHTAKDGNAAFPLKANGPFAKEGFETKYGGYSDLTNPYASLVRSEAGKGKHIYSLEFIPTIARKTLGKDKKALEKYLSEKNGLKNPEILIEKLLRRTIIQIPYKAQNGKEGSVRLGISGKSNSAVICINFSEPHISAQYRKTIKKISKLLGLNDQAGQKTDTKVYEKYGNEDIPGKITRQEILDLFDYITKDIYCRPEFEGLPSLKSTILKVKSYNLEFQQLSTLNQRTCLAAMLKIISCKSAQGTSFEMIDNKTKNAGIIKASKNLSKGTKIIQTSVTGLTERVLFTVPED